MIRPDDTVSHEVEFREVDVVVMLVGLVTIPGFVVGTG